MELILYFKYIYEKNKKSLKIYTKKLICDNIVLDKNKRKNENNLKSYIKKIQERKWKNESKKISSSIINFCNND